MVVSHEGFFTENLMSDFILYLRAAFRRHGFLPKALLLLSVFSSREVCAQSYTVRPVIQSEVAEITQDQSLRSVGKKPLVVYRIPALDENFHATKARYHFYIQAGLHGNEELTSEFANWLVERFRQGQGPLVSLQRYSAAFDVLPNVNPDGAMSRSRLNLSHVNLNRNFSVLWGISRENPGPSTFSESETRAIRTMLLSHHYTAAVDVHGYVNWIVVPSQPIHAVPKKQNSRLTTTYLQWVSDLSNIMQKLDPTYEVRTAFDLGDGGAFEDFAFWKASTPAFCLEMRTAFRYDSEPSRGIAPKARGDVKIDMFEKYEQIIFEAFASRMRESTVINAPAIYLDKNSVTQKPPLINLRSNI